MRFVGQRGFPQQREAKRQRNNSLKIPRRYRLAVEREERRRLELGCEEFHLDLDQYQGLRSEDEEAGIRNRQDASASQKKSTHFFSNPPAPLRSS